MRFDVPATDLAVYSATIGESTEFSTLPAYKPKRCRIRLLRRAGRRAFLEKGFYRMHLGVGSIVYRPEPLPPIRLVGGHSARHPLYFPGNLVVGAPYTRNAVKYIHTPANCTLLLVLRL